MAPTSPIFSNLVGYWIDDYDWYRDQRRMNEFTHRKSTIQDIPIHFIHELGKGPEPIPLILSHGWPWTFWDYEKVISPLADPAAFGGDPRDSFDVVVPSLPGYGFSTPLRVPGINYWRTADLWVELMEDVLGYKKFAAYGNDWGAFVTAQLGHKYAERMIAVYVSMTIPLDFFMGNFPKEDEYAPEERAWYRRLVEFSREGSGYSAIQSTKPQRRCRTQSTIHWLGCAPGSWRSGATFPSAGRNNTSTSSTGKTFPPAVISLRPKSPICWWCQGRR